MLKSLSFQSSNSSSPIIKMSITYINSNGDEVVYRTESVGTVQDPLTIAQIILSLIGTHL